MKKILIRSPQTKERIIYSIPFFHYLKQEFPESQLNIIVNQGLEKYYLFLPIKLNIFLFPPSENDLPGIHRFARNKKEIFGIETFYDLENTFKSAFLGFSFNSKERIGQQLGFKKYLYNNPINLGPMTNEDQYFLKYLASLINKNPYEFESPIDDKMLRERIENPLIKANQFKDVNKLNYFLFYIKDLGPSRKVLDNGLFEETPLIKFWKEVIQGMRGQKVVFYSDTLDLELNEFIGELLAQNEYFHQRGQNYNQLLDLVLHADAIITDCEITAQLARYFKKEAFLIMDQYPILNPLFNSHTYMKMDDAFGKISLLSGDKEEIKNTQLMEFIIDFLTMSENC